jgi:hypothetical protein
MKESFFSARKAFPMRGFTIYITFFLLTSTCSIQETDQYNTGTVLNNIPVIDLFHNEIISFCQRKATIRLAADSLHWITDLFFSNLDYFVILKLR